MPYTESIEAFIFGNNDALAHYYNEWKAELFLVAYHYMRNSDDAEDVLADCFEKLMNMSIERRKEKFDRQKIYLKHLLLVMVKNRCIDILRTTENRRRIQQNLFRINKDKTYAFENMILDKESFKSLCHCLPKKESQILTMHLDGHSHEEIAKNFTLSEKTVKNNITIAKSKVRLLWQDFMA